MWRVSHITGLQVGNGLQTTGGGLLGNSSGHLVVVQRTALRWVSVFLHIKPKAFFLSNFLSNFSAMTKRRICVLFAVSCGFSATGVGGQLILKRV